jgi:transcriptional regulator with XRE-family HTH domain
MGFASHENTGIFFMSFTGSIKVTTVPSTATAIELERPEGERLLASDIRALRKARSLTLAEVGLKLGRSIGWLSQVERGMSIPSLSDLRAFADLFEVPVSLFFSHDVPEESERGLIVRAERRRSLGTNESGLVEELLSPDLGGSFEMLRSVFAPGAELQEPALRQTEEAGYVISGIFELEIDGDWHRLEAGDSFRFEKKPFRWRNPGAEPAVVIWTVSPPVY